MFDSFTSIIQHFLYVLVLKVGDESMMKIVSASEQQIITRLGKSADFSPKY